jgi:ariadne-1
MDKPEVTLASAGIHENGAQPRLKRVRGFTCDVCYEEDGSKETLALSCDHRCESSLAVQYAGDAADGGGCSSL